MAKSIIWSQLAVLSCATLIVCFIYLPRRVPNLPQAKSDVMHYVTEGKYNQDLQQASWQGRYFLNQYTGSKPAIVFDIDETVFAQAEALVERQQVAVLVTVGIHAGLQAILTAFR